MKVFVPRFEKRGGLVPVVTVERSSGCVLMLAYANDEAWRLTLETGMAHYYSTSKKCLHRKGEESGNVQQVFDVLVDCDGDALVYVVHQVGAGACHTNASTCFFRSVIGARQICDSPKIGSGEALSVDNLPVHRTLCDSCEILP